MHIANKNIKNKNRHLLYFLVIFFTLVSTCASSPTTHQSYRSINRNNKVIFNDKIGVDFFIQDVKKWKLAYDDINHLDKKTHALLVHALLVHAFNKTKDPKRIATIANILKNFSIHKVQYTPFYQSGKRFIVCNYFLLPSNDNANWKVMPTLGKKYSRFQHVYQVGSGKSTDLALFVSASY